MSQSIADIARNIAASFYDDGYQIPGSRRKSMKGVTATPNSPDTDILSKLSGMRALSRDLYMNSPLACAILKRHKVLTIGSGLKLHPIIDWETLNLTTDQTLEYEKKLEREFYLWADSEFADYDGNLYFGELLALGYFNLLLNGDFFWIPVWRQPENSDFPFELSIKMIDADLVRTPTNLYNSANIKGGVEIDNSGHVVAYYVHDSFYDYDLKNTYTRIPVFDETGRKQIYHVFDPDRIAQRRGVPLLANCADSLKQMTRLTDAQVMSALISSFFTVFVKDMSGLGTLMGPAFTPNETVTGGGRWSPDSAESGARNAEDGNDLEMGHGNITYVDENKDVTIADPHKTDANFQEFYKLLSTIIAASTNLPIEQAMMRYETSYTAARAAANDVWQYRLSARSLIGRKMAQPIYEELLSESVIKNRLSLKNYFSDYAYKKAWSRAQWIGSGRGKLDPLKEAKASETDLKNFLTTHEDEYLTRHDGRWFASMDKLASEKRYIEDLGIAKSENMESEEIGTIDDSND